MGQNLEPHFLFSKFPALQYVRTRAHAYGIITIPAVAMPFKLLS